MKPQPQEAIVEAVHAAMDELNEQLPVDGQLQKLPEAPLFGRAGPLDSLGLVNLIAATEQQVEEALGVSVSLADEESVSQHHMPFANVSSLVDYVAGLVAAKQHENG